MCIWNALLFAQCQICLARHDFSYRALTVCKKYSKLCRSNCCFFYYGQREWRNRRWLANIAENIRIHYFGPMTAIDSVEYRLIQLTQTKDYRVSWPWFLLLLLLRLLWCESICSSQAYIYMNTEFNMLSDGTMLFCNSVRDASYHIDGDGHK